LKFFDLLTPYSITINDDLKGFIEKKQNSGVQFAFSKSSHILTSNFARLQK